MYEIRVSSRPCIKELTAHKRNRVRRRNFLENSTINLYGKAFSFPSTLTWLPLHVFCDSPGKVGLFSSLHDQFLFSLTTEKRENRFLSLHMMKKQLGLRKIILSLPLSLSLSLSHSTSCGLLSKFNDSEMLGFDCGIIL